MAVCICRVDPDSPVVATGTFSLLDHMDSTSPSDTQAGSVKRLAQHKIKLNKITVISCERRRQRFISVLFHMYEPLYFFQRVKNPETTLKQLMYLFAEHIKVKCSKNITYMSRTTRLITTLTVALFS